MRVGGLFAAPWGSNVLATLVKYRSIEIMANLRESENHFKRGEIAVNYNHQQWSTWSMETFAAWRARHTNTKLPLVTPLTFAPHKYS